MKRAYFFGDSNTYGYDPRGVMGGRYPAEYRWPDILQEELKEKWLIIADGMNGRQIPDRDSALPYLEKKLTEVAPLDFFAVMLGTNDICLSYEPFARPVIRKMESFCISLDQYFAKENVPCRRAVIAPPPFTIPGPEGARFQRCMEEVWQGYKVLASTRKWEFIDTTGWSLDMAYDGVHLSERGHMTFAAQLDSFLR